VLVPQAVIDIEIKVCVVGGWVEGILKASVNDEIKRETVLRFRHVNYHYRPIEYRVYC
jgi:hypothetical protein